MSRATAYHISQGPARGFLLFDQYISITLRSIAFQHSSTNNTIGLS